MTDKISSSLFTSPVLSDVCFMKGSFLIPKLVSTFDVVRNVPSLDKIFKTVEQKSAKRCKFTLVQRFLALVTRSSGGILFNLS